MEPFKKYVTCTVPFFTPFTCVTLCITSPVLFTKNNELWNKRKDDFLYIYLCIYLFIYLFIYLIRYLQAIKRIVLTALGYHFVSIEVKDRIFRRNSSFRHLWQSINNPSSSNIFVQIIYSYLRYTYRLVDVFSLVICCNIIKASWETKMEIMSCRKTYIEEFIWGTSLFWQHTLFSMSCLLPPPFPKDVLVEWPLGRFIIKF